MMNGFRSWLKYILVLAGSMLMSSCFIESGPVVPITNLIPLAPGNRWDFVWSYFDSLGNVTSTQPDSMYFVRDTIVDGIKWTCGFGPTAGLGFRNTPRGLTIRLVMRTSTPGEYLRYPYPAIIDLKYGYPLVWSDATIEDTTTSIRLVATDVPVTVPAGTFKCIQYRIEERGLISPPFVGAYTDEFISPDYGWIRQRFYAHRVLGGGIFLANSVDLHRLQLK